ncbi:MAG: hypothetical protein EHM44_04020 [Ignavibacteriales bacterium]|nr:MAG: hypothetical protein EHM44_04020 [Ignavibacteriales bacterium]
MRRILLLFLSLLFTQCSSEKYSEKDFYSESTLKSEREKFLKNSIDQKINQSLSFPLNDSTEDKYMSAFWAIELLQYRNETSDTAIKNSLKDFHNRSSEFQRALLEVIYSLYQNEFNREIFELIKTLNNPKLLAMCVRYLKNTTEIESLKKLTEDFSMKFLNADENPIISMLKYDLNTNFRSTTKLPPLIDLLNNGFGSDKLVFFSIQRLNRDYPGLLIIKKPDGKFLRDESGEIFSVSQLARAITDLPGYITNGNTPEGILSIQGTDFSKNVFIGPSPNLQLVLPYEVSLQKYFHSEINDSIWNKKYYADLLPESWKDYFPIYESYYAGKAGRNEIIAHGTTIDPEFYKGKSYYPFTPSLGCLTTKEIWSGENGKLVESGQIKLMNALSYLKSDRGFFIVVNIDDTHLPVTLDEIKDLILNAER